LENTCKYPFADFATSETTRFKKDKPTKLSDKLYTAGRGPYGHLGLQVMAQSWHKF
jgi:hypothetical protein